MSDETNGVRDDTARRIRPTFMDLRAAVLVGGLLVLSAVLGVVGGWWWWHWWGPAPKGQVYALNTGGYSWLANPPDPGQAHVAASTFQFVAVGFALALVAGVAAGVLGRHRPYAALVAAALGGIVGVVVMRAVGMAFSPPDPSRWADAAHLGRSYPGSLRIGGWPPYLAWPVGSLFGFLAVMLAISSEERIPPSGTSGSSDEVAVPVGSVGGPARPGDLAGGQ